MAAYTKLYWVDSIASLTLIFCLGLIAGARWETLNLGIVALVIVIACIAKIWTLIIAKQQR